MPRLALAAILMGVSLYFVTPLIEPYMTGSILRRAGGLLALVSAGGAVYAIACLLTGGFVLGDLKLMMRRASRT